MKKGVLFLVGAVAAVLIYVLWSEHSARLKAERELGLDAARMVNSTLEKRAELKVATLTGDVTATASYDGTVFNPKQTSTMPATVDYFVNLGRVGRHSYRWASESKTLFVDIPDVRIGKPNLDEAAAVVKQEGVIVTREAGKSMSRQISERAALRASEEAKKPEHLNRAKDNAREVIARLAREPLIAAGLGEVRVAVRFPSERRDIGAPLGERWDESRRPEDVLRERREKQRQ